MEEGGQKPVVFSVWACDLVLQLASSEAKRTGERRREADEGCGDATMKVLATMEQYGVRIDEKALAAMSQDLRKESEKVQKKRFTKQLARNSTSGHPNN